MTDLPQSIIWDSRYRDPDTGTGGEPRRHVREDEDAAVQPGGAPRWASGVPHATACLETASRHARNRAATGSGFDVSTRPEPVPHRARNAPGVSPVVRRKAAPNALTER